MEGIRVRLRVGPGGVLRVTALPEREGAITIRPWGSRIPPQLLERSTHIHSRYRACLRLGWWLVVGYTMIRIIAQIMTNQALIRRTGPAVGSRYAATAITTLLHKPLKPTCLEESLKKATPLKMTTVAATVNVSKPCLQKAFLRDGGRV